MNTPGFPVETLASRAGAAFAAYQQGDSHRLSELVDLVTPLLWHTVRAQRVSHDQAEDVVQTTWLRLVHHAETIQDPRAVLAWLIITAKRESWRVVKDSRRTKPMPDAEDADDIPDLTTAGPESAALATAEGRVLWRHIESLSERCRSLLRVVAFSDRPDYATVAQALGMPIGSIGPTRGRCLAKLRLLLDSDPHWGIS
ncbi:MAG: sigma-70 family RNA polymerase sigma factor [Actinomycetota bacterium]|nr:sigma-70 family RNA polymerase sigma factor [Actinomycetota bacterium]